MSNKKSSLLTTKSPLLNAVNSHQSYSQPPDDLPTIKIHNKAPTGASSGSNSPSKKSLNSISANDHEMEIKSLISTPSPSHHHHHHHRNVSPTPSSIKTTHDRVNKTCGQYIGRCLFQCRPLIEWIKIGYYVVLCPAIIVCVLLIISRLLQITNTYPNLFHSDIFESDSVPLLLTANIIMMISYSLENFLMLRICLGIGCFCFALWGLTNDPMLLDTAMFNTVMMLFNVRHAVRLAYAYRHISFEREWEQIYVNVFEGYLNRVDFKKLVDISYKRTFKKGVFLCCALCIVLYIYIFMHFKGEIFKKKGDEITSLCCLVSGRISVVREVEFEIEHSVKTNRRLRKVKSVRDMHSAHRMKGLREEFNMDDSNDSDIGYFLRNPHFVNLCHKNQFVEAPQWLAANLKPDGDRFTVSFVAVDDCEYIKWPRENIIELCAENPVIYNALQGVMGLHTAHALLKSREYNKIQQELSIHESRNVMRLRDAPSDRTDDMMRKVRADSH